jgi:hypothetical protein
MAFPTGWTKRHKITIDNTKVVGTGDLSNFPVLLTESNFLTDAFDNTDNGGGDLRFSSDVDGTTQLACEVVKWDNGVTDKAEVWVKVPTLDGDADTVIYVWYGNTGQTQPAVSTTYGRNSVWSNGYQGVYHLEGNYNDSTGQNDLAPGNAPGTLAASKIGAGYNFEFDTSDYVTNASPTNMVRNNSTIQAWYRPESTSEHHFMGLNAGNVANGYGLVNNSGTGRFSFYNRSGDECFGTTMSTGTWYFMVGVMDSDGDVAILYQDLTAYSVSQTTDITGAEAFSLGREGAWAEGSRYADGDIDEARYSNVVRTANWLNTEYNNQYDPSTFSQGSDATSIGGEVIIGPFPTFFRPV